MTIRAQIEFGSSDGKNKLLLLLFLANKFESNEINQELINIYETIKKTKQPVPVKLYVPYI